MIWAGWGLKDKFTGDPDIWLCHQCGDCSDFCPRGVNPGDVFSALRHWCYLNYAKPKFMGFLLSSPKFLPVVLAIPVIFILMVIFLSGTLQIPEGEIVFSKFFPHMPLNISFFLILSLVVIGLVLSLRKFWKNLSQHYPANKKSKGLIKSIYLALKDILIHRNFTQCNSRPYKFSSHFLVFWGFVLLLIVTVCAIISTIFFNYPLPFYNPIKILGNIGGIMLFTGCGIMIYKRIFNNKSGTKSNYFDWTFLLSLFILTSLGFATEILRLVNSSFAYYIYFLHLIFVFLIIIYIPYTKFGHFIYRTVALTYLKSIERQS